MLRRLGITGSGQSAAAEDADIVTDAWASIYPQLRRFGIAPWDDEAIEEEAQEPLSKYVAGQIAMQFGFSSGRLAEIKAESIEGFRQLREQSSSDKHPVRHRPEWF